MLDSLVVQEILEDENFKKLVEDKTSLEEFTQLLDEHCAGYSQKKRFSDGLKDFSKKVEDAENRLVVARNVGKSKVSNPEDKELTDNHTSFELKQKASTVNAKLQLMIDEGSITHAEKPAVLDNLKSRIAKAKEAGKEKLEEKLDKMATSVVRAPATFVLPVANIEKFHELDRELTHIAKLEKLKKLDAALRERVENKATVQGDFDTLVDASRMWFETAIEFKPRLHAGMADWKAGEEERIRLEEEQAFEKKLQEDNAAIEKKRLEAERKQQEADKALEEKLAAKREEAALKPVKAVPQKQVKQPKFVARVDLGEMFHQDMEYEEVSAAQIQADLDEKAKQREFAKALAELKAAKADAEAATRARQISETKDAKAAKDSAEAYASSQQALKDTLKAAKKSVKTAELAFAVAKPAPAKKEIVIKEKADEDIEWEKHLAHLKQEEKLKAVEEKLAQKRLEALSAPKKEVKEPPKKAEKKVETKMNLNDFYSEDLMLENLAAQEAKERILREAAEKEAAIIAAQEEAAWEAEEAAWWEAEEKRQTEEARAKIIRLGQTGLTPAAQEEALEGAAKEVATAIAAEKAASAAAHVEAVEIAKPAPAPKLRKVPLKLENKWGAPATPAWLGGGDDAEDGMDLLEQLAKQEAVEKKERAAAKKIQDAEDARWAAEEEAAALAAPSLVTANTSTVKIIRLNQTGPSADSKAAPAAPRTMVEKAEAAAKITTPALRKAPVKLENKWGAPAPVVAEQIADDEETDPSLAEAFAEAPSLADALTAPAQKKFVAPPKKKEKKKWGKIDVSAIGFDSENPNNFA